MANNDFKCKGIAFGIALEANLTIGKNFKTTVTSVFDFAFWPIFGEIEKVLDELEIRGRCVEAKQTNQTNSTNCDGIVTIASSYLLLMVYMITATILLINLLIAIFRLDKTFHY